MEQKNQRNVALRALEDIYKDGVFMKEAIEKHVYALELDKQSRAFISRLINGTVENTILIDYVINQFSKTKTNKQKKIILYILRLSVYQILFMDSIPDRAACNEGVKLVKKRKFHALSGFVNGVLRNVSRNKEQINMPKEKEQPNDYLSVTYSTPLWLVNYLLEQYEYNQVERILEASLSEALVSIRLNDRLANLEQLKSSLSDDGASWLDGTVLEYALKIKGFNKISELESYKLGYFQVQDESSMLVAEALNPKVGDLVIDVCSAPGGKTTHAAQRMNGIGQVIARDVSHQKLDKIRDNCRRLKLDNVMVEQWDGLELDHNLVGKADGVIADVPCSGLGIIKKKPDIKFNMNMNKIDGLIPVQRGILHNAAQYVKKGGTLIYSTCTINKNENEKNVQWFLENHNDFVVEDIKLKGLKKEIKLTEGMITLLPEVNGVDGFFIAKFKRK